MRLSPQTFRLPSVRLARPATGPGRPERRNPELEHFTALFALYLAANLVFRWLTWTLFHGHGAYGWQQPGNLELGYLVASATLPALLAGMALTMVARALPRRARRIGVITIALLSVVVIELDMAWVHMSGTHISGRDVHMFLTESWSDHFGLRPSDLRRTGMIFAGHAVVLVALMALARRLGRWTTFPALSSVGFRIGVGVLVLVDSIVVGRTLADNQSDVGQWQSLADKNPLRIDAMDAAWVGSRPEDADLAAARTALADTPAALPDVADSTLAGPLVGIQDVVFLVVESWTPSQVDGQSMPFLSSLLPRAIQAGKHYSAGNCTHYGLMGLIFGEPVTFYRGAEGSDLPQSAYLDRFTEHGFESRYVGSDLSSFRQIGEYMRNFTRPDHRGKGPSLVEIARDELARDGHNFLFLFYGDTHYPYPHDPAYARFQPEVPDDFDYQRWDVADYAPEIVNRYRNGLLQLDTWMEAVFQSIDLDHTLVVITGDHGQEFFEGGRLAHGSALDAEQLMTPLLILGPGLEPRKIDEITSHADVMPSVMELLGWSVESGGFGRSIFQQGGRRVAIAAHNNHTRAPARWAVLTDDESSLFRGGRSDTLELIRLTDRAGTRLGFADSRPRWDANFGVARQLTDVLRQAP
jgi:hypothetical protein